MVVSDTYETGARARTPVHLWIVGVLALLWNMMGAFDYLATKLQLDFYMSQFSEEQLAYFYGFPAWVVAAWAFGVWGALVGSVGLLLRRKWSVWAFAVSLAGMAVSTIFTLLLLPTLILSPSLIPQASCPSIVIIESPPSTSSMVSVSWLLITTGLAESEWGQSGVRINDSRVTGLIIGPPAASEYAVEPVGVETISPSARYSPRSVSPIDIRR